MGKMLPLAHNDESRIFRQRRYQLIQAFSAKLGTDKQNI
jgi:hypothetical protein